MYKYSLLALTITAFNAFATTELTSHDWVGDNVFTSGVEGPAVDKNGVLYAVNHQTEGTIGKVTGKNQVVTLVTLANGSIANGLRFDRAGNLFMADYVNHNVLMLSAASLVKQSLTHSDVVVYAHNPKMNQPNDLAIMDNGILFASDPNWQLSTGQLWRIDKNGETKLLAANMGTTNGIEVSPDNKTLYVNESVQRKIWQYDLDEKGNVSNKRLLIEFEDFGLDGMRVDSLGNLYVARYGKGVVAIISPAGKLLSEVTLTGQFPTNVAFGGENGKTVFVTMQKRGAIETFTAQHPGRSHALLNAQNK